MKLTKILEEVITEIGDLSAGSFPLQREAIKQAKITREDEDRIKIEIPEIGYVILINTTPESEFSEDISEEELEELGLDYQDFIGKIEHLYINPKSRGEGNAKLLMQKAIQYAEKKGMTPIYLNASPIQAEKGLGLNDLTKFYEKFGFETFKRQGQNNLMIRIS
jgi:GNAT superfamily N-acetyltransferase